MKAVVITSPGTVELRDLPELPFPGAGEVLIKVAHVGICGSDRNTYKGVNVMARYPRVPGHELSGTVLALGSGVPSRWKAGAVVTVSPYTSCGACPACRSGRANCCRDNRTLGVQRDGGMQERLILPHDKLFAAPDGIPAGKLPLAEPLAVAFHAVERASLRPGELVAVLGCGPIGLFVVAVAARMGARVAAVDPNDWKLDKALLLGASYKVNARGQDLHEALAGLSGGDGPAVVIEAAGSVESFSTAVTEVSFAGRVVFIGYVKDPVPYETRLFVQKELDLRGSRNARPEDFEKAVALLSDPGFPSEAVVSKTAPMARAPEVFAALAERSSDYTKIILDL